MPMPWGRSMHSGPEPVPIRALDGGRVLKTPRTGIEWLVRHSVDHPTFVPLLDMPSDGRRPPSLVLQRAAASLEIHARLVGGLRPGQVVGVAHALVPALERLHRAGLAHGDLHPGNVLVAATGAVWLADFDASGPVGAAAWAGRAGYLAPERRLCPRADQWSLAATLTAVMAPSGSDRATRAVRSVLARARAPQPAHRYRTLAQLAVALGAAAEPAPLLASIPPPGVGMASSRSPARSASAPDAEPPVPSPSSPPRPPRLVTAVPATDPLMADPLFGPIAVAFAPTRRFGPSPRLVAGSGSGTRRR